MIDGPTEVIDLEKTNSNKNLVKNFVDDILVNVRMENHAAYFNGDSFERGPFQRISLWQRVQLHPAIRLPSLYRVIGRYGLCFAKRLQFEATGLYSSVFQESPN